MVFTELSDKGREQFESFCLQHRLLLRCGKCHWNVPVCDKKCENCKNPMPET